MPGSPIATPPLTEPPPPDMAVPPPLPKAIAEPSPPVPDPLAMPLPPPAELPKPKALPDETPETTLAGGCLGGDDASALPYELLVPDAPLRLDVLDVPDFLLSWPCAPPQGSMSSPMVATMTKAEIGLR